MPDNEAMPMIAITPTRKRIRAIVGGETVLDTQNAVLLKEGPRPPKYYIPQADLVDEYFSPTNHRTQCPYKGEASYWTVSAGGKTLENSAWSYAAPMDAVAAIAGLVSLDWKAADKWLEEDEEVIVHARDPHVRVDILASARPVKVELDGIVLAETSRAMFCFETAKVTRYYIPRADVAMDYLEPSAAHTACPYKGEAGYFSVRTPQALHQDLVWYYADPLDECLRIKDLLCFYNEKVDALTVDGQSVL